MAATSDIAPGTKVTVGVHERTGHPGYIIRIRAGDRLVKFPVGEFEEAVALARSIVDYVEAGLPIQALVGERSVAAGRRRKSKYLN